MLVEAFRLQRELQIKSYGKDPADLEGEEQIQFLKDMHIAQTDEMHETLGEIGWKPWATSRHVNIEAAQGELVDEFHFFLNRCMALRLTPEQLFAKYQAKRTKNQKRQEAGYDGVSTKCPGCKRALDDEAVKCRETRMPSQFWCDAHHTYYHQK